MKINQKEIELIEKILALSIAENKLKSEKN